MPRPRKPPRPGALSEQPPLLILSQIAILQVGYYVAGAALILFSMLVAGRTFNLDLVFEWRSLRGDTTQGWMLGLVWMIDSFLGAIAILLLIRRSKLVLDFALTLHFIHLLITSLYSHSLPRNMLWWILQVCSAALMTSLGMWACQYRELRPIMFGSGGGVKTKTQAQIDGSSEEERRGFLNGADGGGDDVELGSMKSGRRGRDRDTGSGNVMSDNAGSGSGSKSNQA